MNEHFGKFSASLKAATPWLGLAIKLVVVPVAAIGLIWTFMSGETASRLSHPNATALLALALNEVGLIVTALRMRSILAAFSIELKYFQSVKIHLQSLMYFFVIPGSVGMEISRFAKLRTHAQVTSQASLAFAVLGDRVIGVAAAIIITAATLPFVDLPVKLSFDGRTIGAFAIALAVCIGAAVFLSRYKRVREILSVGAEFLRRPGAALALLLLSIAAQAATALAVFFAALSIGIAIPPTAMVFGLSVSVLSMIVPVSFVGAGPAEAVAFGIFIALGYSAGDAVLVAALAYGGRLVGALQGAILEMIDGGMTLHTALRKQP